MNLLKLSWSISKGRNSEGYNICRLDDMSTGERFKCMGGGYDMIGTCFGEWLQKTYQDRLLKIKDKFSRYENGKFISIDETQKEPFSKKLYGGTYYTEKNVVMLDGACGIDSMRRIAEAIGLEITDNFNRRTRRNDGFFFSEKTL